MTRNFLALFRASKHDTHEGIASLFVLPSAAICAEGIFLFLRIIIARMFTLCLQSSIIFFSFIELKSIAVVRYFSCSLE